MRCDALCCGEYVFFEINGPLHRFSGWRFIERDKCYSDFYIITVFHTVFLYDLVKLPQTVKTQKSTILYSKFEFTYRRLSGTTSYLAARTKNVVSQRFYGKYLASIRRDTTFFVRAARWVVLRPPGEMRPSSSARRNTTLFHSAVDIV